MSDSFSIVSPAKLNLGLRVVGRRQDGFHLLESLFWPIDLVDTLQFESKKSDNRDHVQVVWEKSHPNGKSIVSQENIVSRALNKIREESQIPNYQVTINKRITLGGGLGGGSSNAAATLNFFSRIGRISTEDSLKIALNLGADVPFFLGTPQPTWVTGIGETRARLKVDSSLASQLRFVLIFPPFESMTAEVFSQYRNQNIGFSRSQTQPFTTLLTLNSLINYLQATRNDLESIIVSSNPTIGHALTALLSAGAVFASMTGSGSTIFGVFPDPTKAKKAAQVLDPFCRQASCRIATAATYCGG